MRIATTLLVLIVLFVGAFAVARANEEPTEGELLEAKVEALEAQVEYLRAREKALSTYVLRNAQRAAGLEAVAKRARAAGFENRQIPADSRKILLRGMEALAASLREGLPAVTRKQQALLKTLK